MPKINKKHFMKARRLLYSQHDLSTSEQSNSIILYPTEEEDSISSNENQQDYSQPSSVVNFDNEIENSYFLSESSNEAEFVTRNIPLVSDSNLSPTQFSDKSIPKNNINSSIARWAIEHKIPHVAIKDLLSILKSFHDTLPVDPRTLLHTPRKADKRYVDPGYYYHFGVENCLKNLISQCDSRKLIDINSIEVLINIDGLPLSKSSSSQVYPILCSLVVNEKVVDMIGIYHGYEKPKDPNDFLSDFIYEVIHITTNGFIHNSKSYIFKIKAFVCDVPAKSYILRTKGHSGYYSCTKCDIEGNYINGRVCFPNQKFKARTDFEFRAKTQIDHHVGTSIIEQIPNFNLIDNFVLDPMHLLHLGIVKKLIHHWCNGKPPSKLSFNKISEISNNLINLRDNIPSEFNRKPRRMEEYKRWKATEFRQLLLYTGPVVLKKVLRTDLYLNFMSLHVGITILSNKKLQTNFIESAHKSLCYFFQTFLILYGKENASHNIHNLLHISDDSKKFGPLDKYAAYPFENYMSTILRMIRKHDKPLEQIVRRKEEMKHVVDIDEGSHRVCNYPEFKIEHNTPYQFQKAIFSEFTLTTKYPDNCCSLKNGSIIIVENFITVNNQKCVVGRKFRQYDDYYTKPCSSSDLDIYAVNLNDLDSVETWNINEVDVKYILMNLKSQPSVAMPLVHI